MKLPQIVATEGVPVAGGARMSAGAASAPYQALAEAGRALSYTGGSIAYAGDVIAQAQEAKRNLATRTEAAAAKAQLEVGLATLDGELKSTERDPDGYLKAYQDGAKALRDSIRKAIKYPDAQSLYDQQSMQLIGIETVKARGHYNALFKENRQADVASTLDAIKTRAGLRSIDDAEGFEQDVLNGVAAIANLEPLMGRKWVVDETVKLRAELLDQRAQNHVDQDPASFEARAHEYALLGGKLPVYQARAAKQIETERKNRVEEAEKWQKRVEDEAEKARQTQLLDLRSQARNKNLTLQQLEDYRRQRVVASGAEYDTLYKIITEPNEQASDPSTRTDVASKAFRDVPQITVDQIWRLHGAGKLNDKDAEEAAKYVTSRTNDLRGEGLTQRNEKFTKGQTVIDRALGFTGMQDKYDDQDKGLLALATQDYVRRVIEGKEDPLEVANELAFRYGRIRQERAKLDVRVLGQTLRFPAATAAEAMAKLNQNRAQMPKYLIDQETRKIADMTRAEELAAGGGLVTTPPTASKSSSSTPAPTQGTAKPLRKPGTKAQSGRAED
jgi:hypothetical protein